jgi:hypothetical protein
MQQRRPRRAQRGVVGPRSWRTAPLRLVLLEDRALPTSFIGINLQDQIDGGRGATVPPDTMGAIGPNYFVENINSNFAIYTRSGALVSVVSPDTFFDPDGPGTITVSTFDPRILYDHNSGRWFATAMDAGGQGASDDGELRDGNDEPPPYDPGGRGGDEEDGEAPSGEANDIILAVSDTSDPTGPWHRYILPVGVPFDGTYHYITDFATLGVDSNGVYFGMTIIGTDNNSTTINDPTFAKIAATPLAPLLSASPPAFNALTVFQFSNITDMYSSPQPALNYDPVGPTAPAFFVASSPNDFANIAYRRLTWSGGVASLSGTSVLTTPGYGNPLNAPHSGNTGSNIEVSDDRLLMAFVRNGHLWTARNVGVNAAGGSALVDRTGVEWLDTVISGPTLSLNQSGRIFDPAATNPMFYYYPSLAVTGQGNMRIAFSGSSATTFVGSFSAGRQASDPPGSTTAPVVVKAGERSYNLTGSNRKRWGDYSFTSIDPNDDMTVWTVQEYAYTGNPANFSGNSWGTWIKTLDAPPPATPASASASVAQGQSNVNIVVTGTSANGSGFFDPGAGFPNHITASVSGGGVTVNSVTYTDPTHITLNLSVAGSATAGVRNIAVTNPDGQSATGTAVLAVTPAGLAVPTLSVTPNPVAEGGTVLLSVSFQDITPQALGAYNVVVTWGDAGVQTLAPTSSVAAGGTTTFALSSSHTYVDGGNPNTTNTITVIVRDTVDTDVVTSATTVTVTNVAPTVSITATDPGAPLEGGSITVAGIISDPAGANDLMTVTWSVTGPGGFSTSATTVGMPGSATGASAGGFVFLTPDDGIYTITLTAHDEDGGTATPALTTVSVANVAPVVAISNISSPLQEGTPITVRSSVTDPGGANDTPTFTYTVFKGTTATPFAGGMGNPYVFTPDDGDDLYTLRVVVNDKDGGTGSTSVNIPVANVPPTVTIVGGSVVNEGVPYTVVLSSFDPGTDTITQVVIDWGDNVSPTTQTFTTPVPVINGTATLSATHTYTDGGAGAGTPYTITATVADEDGTFTNAGSHVVTVANVLPTPTIGAITPVGTKNEGSPVTVVGTASDPAGANDTISLGWVVTNSGGATIATQAVTAGASSTFAFVPPDGNDTYIITLIARDEDGGATASATAITTVSVANVAPQLTISGNASVNEGSPYALTLGSSDPGSDTITRWLIDWGDGTPVQTLTGSPVTSNTAAVTVTHSFADGPNGYFIVATAVDEDGTYTAGNAVSVSVANVPPMGTIGGNAAAVFNVPYTLTLGYTEPGADTVTRVRIDWGDGQVDNVTTVTIPGPRTSASIAATFTHAYSPSAAARTISATLFDEDNATATAGYALGNNVTVTPVSNLLTAVTIENVPGAVAAANPALNSRSQVHSVVLSFSGPLSPETTGLGALNPANYTLAPSTFNFTQAGAAPFNPPTPLPTINVALQSGPGGANSQVVLTFAGNTVGGSLQDGDYKLTVAALTDANGQSVPTVTVNFRRLFGDANNNGRLDFADFTGIYFATGFRLGDPQYNPALDSDSDGDVDILDQLTFFSGSRFTRSNAGPPNQFPPIA